MAHRVPACQELLDRAVFIAFQHMTQPKRDVMDDLVGEIKEAEYQLQQAKNTHSRLHEHHGTNLVPPPIIDQLRQFVHRYRKFLLIAFSADGVHGTPKEIMSRIRNNGKNAARATADEERKRFHAVLDPRYRAKTMRRDRDPLNSLEKITASEVGKHGDMMLQVLETRTRKELTAYRNALRDKMKAMMERELDRARKTYMGNRLDRETEHKQQAHDHQQQDEQQDDRSESKSLSSKLLSKSHKAVSMNLQQAFVVLCAQTMRKDFSKMLRRLHAIATKQALLDSCYISSIGTTYNDCMMKMKTGVFRLNERYTELQQSMHVMMTDETRRISVYALEFYGKICQWLTEQCQYQTSILELVDFYSQNRDDIRAEYDSLKDKFNLDDWLKQDEMVLTSEQLLKFQSIWSDGNFIVDDDDENNKKGRSNNNNNNNNTGETSGYDNRSRRGEKKKQAADEQRSSSSAMDASHASRHSKFHMHVKRLIQLHKYFCRYKVETERMQTLSQWEEMVKYGDKCRMSDMMDRVLEARKLIASFGLPIAQTRFYIVNNVKMVAAQLESEEAKLDRQRRRLQVIGDSESYRIRDTIQGRADDRKERGGFLMHSHSRSRSEVEEEEEEGEVDGEQEEEEDGEQKQRPRRKSTSDAEAPVFGGLFGMSLWGDSPAGEQGRHERKRKLNAADRDRDRDGKSDRRQDLESTLAFRKLRRKLLPKVSRRIESTTRLREKLASMRYLVKTAERGSPSTDRFLELHHVENNISERWQQVQDKFHSDSLQIKRQNQQMLRDLLQNQRVRFQTVLRDQSIEHVQMTDENWHVFEDDWKRAGSGLRRLEDYCREIHRQMMMEPDPKTRLHASGAMITAACENFAQYIISVRNHLNSELSTRLIDIAHAASERTEVVIQES